MPVVEPVDAATVILARAGINGDPWECFMVRRPAASDFAADVYVFPGGKVDVADRSQANYAVDPKWLDVRAEGPAIALAARAAACRELFEEAAVLLAGRKEGRLGERDAARLSERRNAMARGEMTLAQLGELEDLSFRFEDLHPISRWITPDVFPRRYDTRFYLAELPAEQTPIVADGEITHGMWIAPGEALRRFRAREFPLVFATEKHLERLARYDTIHDLIDSVLLADLQPVMPVPIPEGNSYRFVIPDRPETTS
ncbi:MAG: NUDIX hydrolase [Chloroflexota bacterium]